MWGTMKKYRIQASSITAPLRDTLLTFKYCLFLFFLWARKRGVGGEPCIYTHTFSYKIEIKLKIQVCILPILYLKESSFSCHEVFLRSHFDGYTISIASLY